jgi:hypothetical protein
MCGAVPFEVSEPRGACDQRFPESLPNGAVRRD